MTDDRKEPTLSPLKPDPDEIEQRQQRAGAKPPGARPTASRESARTQTEPQRPVVVRSSKLAPFAFLLAITGLGLAGFAYWQLLEAQKETQAAVTRIADLEQRLEMTGDESEASMAAVQAKLKWADSEIRKLWGVSYDTNRKAIAENKGAIAAASKQVSTVENKLNASLKDVRSDVKKVNATVSGLQAKLDEAEQARLQLQKQTQEVADAMRQLREQQNALQGRVRTNEQAIEAIDTFRRSVNRDILQLKSKASTTSSGTTP